MMGSATQPKNRYQDVCFALIMQSIITSPTSATWCAATLSPAPLGTKPRKGSNTTGPPRGLYTMRSQNLFRQKGLSAGGGGLFWRAGTTPIFQRRSRNFGLKLWLPPIISGVTPRTAPRIVFVLFLHGIGSESNSRSSSRVAPRMPFHSPRAFFCSKLGWFPGF